MSVVQLAPTRDVLTTLMLDAQWESRAYAVLGLAQRADSVAVARSAAELDPSPRVRAWAQVRARPQRQHARAPRDHSRTIAAQLRSINDHGASWRPCLARSKEIKIYLYVARRARARSSGFADLVRGGITVSALLLAIAYCVLIPLAIWSGAGDEPATSATTTRRRTAIAAIVALGVLALYVADDGAVDGDVGHERVHRRRVHASVCRIRRAIRSSSSSAACSRCCRSRATVAARVNVLAAVCSAVAAGVWFLVAEHVLRGVAPTRWQRIAGGVLAALIGATAFTVWNQSVVNEKVYTVSLAGIALVSWLAVRWSDRSRRTARRPRARDDRVSLRARLREPHGGHAAGARGRVAVLLRRPATLVRWKLLLACLVALVVGVTPFATQPIRAAHFPAMNEGEPTACRTKLEVSCTFSKATYDAFMYNFNRGQYGKPDSPTGRRRSANRSACGGCTSAGSGCATPNGASAVRSSRCSPRRSSCSA